MVKLGRHSIKKRPNNLYQKVHDLLFVKYTDFDRLLGLSKLAANTTVFLLLAIIVVSHDSPFPEI